MAATLTENVDSREWTTGPRRSVTLHYTLVGTDDDETARDYLLANTSTTYDNLVRDECTLEPVMVDTVNGTGIWDCRVRYVQPRFNVPEVGESSFSFDTGGGTQHITQSLDTARYVASGTAGNHKGAIGVAGENVEGVDIVVPVYNFSETHYLANATVDDAYKLVVFGLTGKVNVAAFKGFAAGEVLFLGASGSQRGTEDWEITFQFAASPNATGLTIGDITNPPDGISKKGWEYMWVEYKDVIDETAERKVKQPVQVNIEQVYESGDFSGLEI